MNERDATDKDSLTVDRKTGGRMSIEAMKRALDALYAVNDLIEHQYTGSQEAMSALQAACDDAWDAIEPLQQAIEQAEKQEPLEYWNAVEGWVQLDEVRSHFDMVGCGTIYKSAGEGRSPLYTTSPQRQPLTMETILSAVSRGWCHEKNASKTMDSELAVAIAKEVQDLLTAAHGIKGEK